MDERVQSKYSMFDVEVDVGLHEHSWRTIKCDRTIDVVECRKCGKQRQAVCDFDDEYA